MDSSEISLRKGKRELVDFLCAVFRNVECISGFLELREAPYDYNGYACFLSRAIDYVQADSEERWMHERKLPCLDGDYACGIVDALS